jgi:hypothetical protein
MATPEYPLRQRAVEVAGDIRRIVRLLERNPAELTEEDLAGIYWCLGRDAGRLEKAVSAFDQAQASMDTDPF